MKASKSSSLIILLALFIGVLLSTPVNAQYENSKLKEKINRFVSYPYLSETNRYGTVDVIFDVAENGTLEIRQIYSEDQVLMAYVERRLSKITLSPEDVKIGTTQQVLLNFKKQDERL